MGRRVEPTAERDGSAQAARPAEVADHDGRARGPGGPLAELHRSYGNRRIQQMVVQAKVRLGPPGDRHEREADRVAEQLVGDAGAASPRPRIGRVAPSGGSEHVDPLVMQLVEASRAGGRPLPAAVRRSFEPRLGADLGGVRVHTGATADHLNRRLSSSAFTTGRDIYFRHGELDLATPDGQEVLAHELVHVVQQAGMATSDGPLVQRCKRKRNQDKKKATDKKKTKKKKRKKEPEEEEGQQVATGDTVVITVQPATTSKQKKRRASGSTEDKPKVKRTKTTPTKRESGDESGTTAPTKKKVERTVTAPSSAKKGKRKRETEADAEVTIEVTPKAEGGEPVQKKHRALEIASLPLDAMGDYLAAEITDIHEPEELAVGVVVWNINHLSRGGLDDDPEGENAKDTPFEVADVVAQLKALGASLTQAKAVVEGTLASVTPPKAARKSRKPRANSKAKGKATTTGDAPVDPAPVMDATGVFKVPTKPASQGKRKHTTDAEPEATITTSTTDPDQVMAEGEQQNAEGAGGPTAEPTAEELAAQAKADKARAALRRELSQFKTDMEMLQLKELEATIEPGLAALLAWRTDWIAGKETTIEERADRLKKIRSLGQVWNRLDRLHTIFHGKPRGEAKKGARRAIRRDLRNKELLKPITKGVDDLLTLIPSDNLAVAISQLKKSAVRDLATKTFFTNKAINLVLINEMNLGMPVLSTGLAQDKGLSRGPLMLAKARVTDKTAKAGAAAVTAEGKQITARQYESYPAVYRTEGQGEGGKGGLQSRGTFYVTTSGQFIVQKSQDPQEYVPWDKSDDDDQSFRGIVIHRLVQGKQEFWAGVIHTTPAGTNLNRTDIWPQISTPLANLETLAQRFKIPLLIGGDFYISSEARVNKPSDAEKADFKADSPGLMGRVKATNTARNIYLLAQQEGGEAEVRKLINSMRPPFRTRKGRDPKYLTTRRGRSASVDAGATPAKPPPKRGRSQSTVDLPTPAAKVPAAEPPKDLPLLTDPYGDTTYTWETYWSSILDVVDDLAKKEASFPTTAAEELGQAYGPAQSWQSTIAGGTIGMDDILRNQWRDAYKTDPTKPGITLRRALDKLGYRIVEGGDPTNPKDRGTRENKAQLADLFIVNSYWKTALSGIVAPQSGRLKPVDDPAGTANKVYWKISDHSPTVLLGSTTAGDPALYQGYDLAEGSAARAALNNRYAWLTFEWRLREVLGEPLPDEPGARDELSGWFDKIRALLKNPILAPDPSIQEDLAALVKPLAEAALGKAKSPEPTDPARQLATEMTGWTPYYPINVGEESDTGDVPSAVPSVPSVPSIAIPPLVTAPAPAVKWPQGQIEHVGNSCYIAALIHVMASTDLYRGLLATTDPAPPVEPELKKQLRNLVTQLRSGATIKRADVWTFITHLASLGNVLSDQEASLLTTSTTQKAEEKAKVAVATGKVVDLQHDASDVLKAVLDQLDLPLHEHVATAGWTSGSDDLHVLPQKTIELKLDPQRVDEDLVAALRRNFVETVEVEAPKKAPVEPEKGKGEGEKEKGKAVKEPVERDRVKLTTFANLPEVLTIVVNRQSYSRELKRPYKLKRRLPVPEVLTIPADLIHADLRAATKTQEVPTYRLVHVTHHEGETTRSGHYTSFGRTEDDRWYQHDDTGSAGRRRIPDPVTLQSALETGFIYVYVRNQPASN